MTHQIEYNAMQRQLLHPGYKVNLVKLYYLEKHTTFYLFKFSAVQVKAINQRLNLISVQGRISQLRQSKKEAGANLQKPILSVFKMTAVACFCPPPIFSPPLICKLRTHPRKLQQLNCLQFNSTQTSICKDGSHFYVLQEIENL